MNNSEGHFANFVYDSRGNLIMAVDPADNHILREYDEYGNMVSITERGGAKTNLLYDIHGNNIKMIDPTGNVIEMTYDVVGRLIKITDASGNSTRYEYNKNDNLVVISPPSGGTIRNKYDKAGRLTSIIPQNGVRTDYSYENGRKDITYAPDTGESIKVSLFYKKDGNIEGVGDPRDFNTTYEYDALGRVTSLTDALGNTEYYRYDSVGNFIQFEDKNGEMTTYTYDLRSRLIQATDPQGHKTSYAYNLNGRILTEENRDSKIAYVYDYSDRLINVTIIYGNFTKTLSYAYDADGNRIAMVDSDGGVTGYNYDKLGKLMNITDPHGGVTTFEYDSNGNMIVTKYPNNVTTEYTYDCEWQITREIISKNEQVMYDYSYSYDSVGNVISVMESGNTTHYTYDKLNKLVKVAYPSGEVAKYTYDKNGNRLKMINGSGTITYTYDEENRLLSDSTGATYTHDKNGNLVGKTGKNGTTSYFYDYENKLTKAVLSDDTNVEYKYFPTGYRMSKTVGNNSTYYIYDKGQVLMELDDEGLPIARYTHGSWVDEPLIISKGEIVGYYLSDALGSIRAIVDADGNSLAEYEYDVFGGIKDVKDVVGLNNPHTFTGKRYDKETGLYCYYARYCCPELGRFISRDPAYTIETSVKNSPYVYVENNPATYTDPSGMFVCGGWCIAGVIVGGAIIVKGMVSAVQGYKKAADKAYETSKNRGRLYNKIAEGRATEEEIKAFRKKFKDALSDTANAAWGLYTSIPGTLAAGGPLPTANADVIAGGVYSYLTALVQEGYFDDVEDIDIEKAKKSLKYLNNHQKKRLKKAIEQGNKKTIGSFAQLVVKRHSHPDDNYDVSTLSYSPTSSASSFNYKPEEIAILANGFYDEFSNLLTELGESSTFVDVYTPLEDLNDYPVLIIPSGGFSGISSLPSFKSKLENYVNDGGTLIVYSQNNGYEFGAVPGDLSGYGWTEDQACHYRSVAINTYHPMLSGQDSVTLDVVVDGYFTSYPENVTILLTRTKNGMPAMLMYEYGNGTGTVIATTIYTDWAYGHHQATEDGKNLLRDMILWAKERKELSEYSSDDLVIIPINVTSYIDLTSDKVKFEVIVDTEVIDTVEVTTSIPPYETKTVNFVYRAPANLGIYHVDYLLVNVSYGEVQRVHDAQKFEVSKYAKNPDGFVYRGKELQIWATSSDDYVAKGSEVLFTVYVRNNGDDSLNGNIGIYGHEAGGAWWAYYANISNITIPPHSEDSFTYAHKMEHSTAVYFGLFDKPVDYKALSMGSFSQKAIAKCERGVWTFSPSVDIGIETDQKEYAKGEDVHVSLNLTNKQKVRHNATVTVRTLDPDNKKIYEDSFDANLSAYETTNKTLSFSLPLDSRCGTYIVTAEAYENGDKIGSNSTYFEVPRFYRLRMSFNKPNKVYYIRQNLSLILNITNTGSSVWSSWINTTIPSLSFSDSKFVSLNPNERREIEYKNLAIPADLTPGKHDVLVNLSYDNSTKKDNFFIPCSDLRIEAGKKYKAGENLSFNISNIGGVDTTFNCSFKFVDWKGKVMQENVVEDAVLSLGNKTISFEIRNQSVNGSYYLLVSCKDKETGKETKLAAVCEVSGLKADLTSDTERKIYFKNENVSILTNITNRDGEIVNGTLNLKIVRVSMPTETERALAIATAKLSAYKPKPEEYNNAYISHNSSHSSSHSNATAEEEESQIEEVPSPSPPPAKSSYGLNLYNLIATARAASPLANSTPTPTPTPTPEHEPENETGELPIEELSLTPSINVTPTPTPEHEPLAPPADEFNESYGNESVIEEPVPLPSPSPPTNLTPSPEEPVPSPPINVTPTPTPEPEEELAEIYKQSAVKLSDIIT